MRRKRAFQVGDPIVLTGPLNRPYLPPLLRGQRGVIIDIDPDDQTPTVRMQEPALGRAVGHPIVALDPSERHLLGRPSRPLTTTLTRLTAAAMVAVFALSASAVVNGLSTATDPMTGAQIATTPLPVSGAAHATTATIPAAP